MSKTLVNAIDRIDTIARERFPAYKSIALEVWEHPEVAFEESRASSLYMDRLASQGFTITEFPEMKHSFVAESGSGNPVIGFMGEYDALPGMSQLCSTEKGAATLGAPGHACGHNLLGAGSLAAAEILAQLLKEQSLPGRVRFYGCPAEESLGRIPLVKAGRFDDASAMITWHPSDVNTPHRYTTSANLAVVFAFKGRASHAGMAPHAGRSALDAAQLFNLSIEFMREHLKPGTMLHYVITDGGQRPNIVPERASTFLYIRACDAKTVRATMKRLLKAAKGACLMTDTSFVFTISHGKCDFRPNDSLQDSLFRAMNDIPLPKALLEEIEFARKLQSTVPKSDRPATLDPIGAPKTILKSTIHDHVGDYGRGKRIGGSLDTGDVSYVAPTGQINAAAWPLGVGAHTWQSCAASASSWAFKAMAWAGSVMALAGYEVATRQDLLDAVRKEHSSKAEPYRSTMDQ